MIKAPQSAPHHHLPRPAASGWSPRSNPSGGSSPSCRWLDGVMKVALESRAGAKAARTKHETVYQCPNCGFHHVATRHRRSERPKR